MYRGHVRGLVIRVTTAKDSTVLQKCAVQRNSQSTLWRLGQKRMKLNKMRPPVPFSLDILIKSRIVQLKKFEVNGRETPMMRDNGASLTIISRKIWQKIGEPKLEKMACGLETYDHYKKKYLDAFFSKVFYENKLIGAKLAVVKAERIVKADRQFVDRC